MKDKILGIILGIVMFLGSVVIPFAIIFMLGFGVSACVAPFTGAWII